MTDTDWNKTLGEAAIERAEDRIARLQAQIDELKGRIAKEEAEIAKVKAEAKAERAEAYIVQTSKPKAEHIFYGADGVERLRFTYLRSAIW